MRISYKLYKILAVMITWANLANGQQNAQYTQYVFNGLVINPAYTGSKEAMSANLLYRNQWTKLNGSPQTQTLTLDGPIANNHLGIGMVLLNDQLGAQRQTAVYGNIAFRVKVSETGRLALGGAFGVSQWALDGNKLQTYKPNDPNIMPGMETRFLPDAKLGLYFNSTRYFAGISAADIIDFDADNFAISKQKRHYFMTAGTLIDLGEHFKIKPSFLIKENRTDPTNIDLNLFVLFNEKIWFGSSYRTAYRVFENKSLALQDKNLQMRSAVALLTEFYVLEQLRLGYSYDISINVLGDYGTHEISLGYYLFQKEIGQRLVNPRYF